MRKIHTAAAENYKHCDYFVLRSPLLPYNQLEKYFSGSDNRKEEPQRLDDAEYRHILVNRHLKQLLELLHRRKKVLEAVRLSSPGFVRRTNDHVFMNDTDRCFDVIVTIYKYLARMTTRSTPFGSFASCTLGQISDTTCLQYTGSILINRVTRLDAGYIDSVLSHINSDRSLRESLLYRANTSIYRIGDSLHYAEAQTVHPENNVVYKLSIVPVTNYLMAVLDDAKQPVYPEQLVQDIYKMIPGTSLHDARNYVNDLIDNQLLVPSLTPPVTGPVSRVGLRFPGRVIGELKAISDVLEVIDNALREIDSHGLGIKIDDYQDILDKAKVLPPEVDDGHFFQLDVNAQFPISIGADIVTQILTGVDILYTFSSGTSHDFLDRFKHTFVERYEGQEVPLCEALDDDAGIGLGQSDISFSLAEPLLQGMPIGELTEPEKKNIAFTRKDLLLMERLYALASDHSLVMELDDDLITAVKEVIPRHPPLPDAWHAMAVILGDTAFGDGHRIFLRAVLGPGPANLIGRFCHLNSNLLDLVRQNLLLEERFHSEAQFAEVAHVPAGRLGNVLKRPVLRNYEIEYLGVSGVPSDRRIYVQDLLVSVKHGEIVLKSKQSGKRILPRLTTAHDFEDSSNLPIYRFLCALQRQNCLGLLNWDWGPLNALSFLPRVTYRHVILSSACWKLGKRDVKEVLTVSGSARFEILQNLREKLHLPRVVTISEGDNEIPFDLTKQLSAYIFTKYLAKYRTSGLWISETLTSEFGAPVTLNGSAYASEVIIPFTKTS